jgi:diaminopimelate epimerase
MAYSFTKYQGLGNDFLVFDLRRSPMLSYRLAKSAVALCDRHFGVGGDGILLIFSDEVSDARLEIYNADGSRPEMCGNGIRCVARYLLDHGVFKQFISIQTDAGVKVCEMKSGSEQVIVQMGAPVIEAARVPFISEKERAIEEDVDGFSITAVSMGNPHAIIFTGFSGVPILAARELGPRIEVHPRFPQKTNVEFAQVAPDGSIDVAIWERGVGITLACGTGACATAVAAILTGRATAGKEIIVRVPGGELGITVAPDLSDVWMRGPAQLVFSGQVDLVNPGT